jgi:hypothetical protein
MLMLMVMGMLVGVGMRVLSVIMPMIFIMLALMRVFMGVTMSVIVLMCVSVSVGVRMAMISLLFMMMIVVVLVLMIVVVIMGKVHIEFHPFNGALRFARSMQMIFMQPKLLQLVLQGFEGDTQVEHSADEHVAANAAENIEVKCFHDRATKALIWLAA